MNEKWTEPNFKGLCALGNWRECEAMILAQKRGSVALEESQLCEIAGIHSTSLEAWLDSGWIEHSIHGVANGTEHCAARTLSVVRQEKGLKWDGFTPKPRGVKPEHFRVRLFSPVDPQSADLLFQKVLSKPTIQ